MREGSHETHLHFTWRVDSQSKWAGIADLIEGMNGKENQGVGGCGEKTGLLSTAALDSAGEIMVVTRLRCIKRFIVYHSGEEIGGVKFTSQQHRHIDYVTTFQHYSSQLNWSDNTLRTHPLSIS